MLDVQRASAGVPGRTTIRDVARLAGVGTKTVSRVMNGEPHVSEATVARVRDAVRTLDYRPHPGASDLRRATRKHRTVGLMIGPSGNPFSMELQRAVEQVAAEHQAMVLAASLDQDAERERETIEALLGRRTEAMLISTPTRSHDYLREEQEHGMAVVFLDGEPIGVEADSVMSDNRGGAAAAARHLMERGHRRIAFLGARADVHSTAERKRGFLAQLEQQSIPERPDYIVEGLDRETAAAATVALLRSEDPPTAIFAAQNLVTVGVVQGLRAVGASHSTALVGFDDVELFDLLEPAVTVIRQDPWGMGLSAAERAFDRLGGDVSPPKQILLPVELIERGSGEITPTD